LIFVDKKKFFHLNIDNEKIYLTECREYSRFNFINVTVPGGSNVEEVESCLHTSVVRRIVGGTEANPDEFPHQAALLYRDGRQFGCGGSLVSPNFVLTAAHCLYTGMGSPTFVRLGSNSLSTDESHTVQIAVSEIFQHPSYNSSDYQNDIGLLKLQSEVKFSNRILPGCLPTQLYSTETAIASGFGLTGFKEDISINLLKVTLDRFTIQECADVYRNSINGTTMLCFGHRTERKDTCNVS
jgi:secreted trypsin-like serine protease